MAEPTPAPSGNKPATNGATKPPGKLSEAGRERIAAAQRTHHAAHPRNTSPISPEKLAKLRALVKGGAKVTDAAKAVGMGYSTAQRYVRADGKPTSPAPRTARAPQKRGGGPSTTPEQQAILRRWVPKMPQKSAQEIAAKAGVHVSTVYFYRKKLVADKDTRKSRRTTSPQPQHEMSLMVEAEFKAAYKKMWEDSWNNRRELTNGEISQIRAYRIQKGEW